jgi:hypothetical protein
MGSPARPTEFGYRACVADTIGGLVIADVSSAAGRSMAARN